jgi:hypothetical protein
VSTATARRAETSTDVRAREVWQRVRGPVAVLLLVVVVALVSVLVSGRQHRGALDPRSASPSGSRALAALLVDQGVELHRVTRAASAQAEAGPGSTVLVVVPDLVDDAAVAALRGSGADLVLLSPTEPERWEATVEAVRPTPSGRRAADCGLRAAVQAGDVDAGGIAYRVRADDGAAADLCYSRGGRPSLVQVRRGAHAITVVGDADAFTNDRLDDRGNAALTMNLLGAQPRLVWYLPTVGDIQSGGQKSLVELIPDGIWWALAQVVVAVVLLAFWRGRRLGPVVPEPLPVAVRAAETVEGRGRLYRRAGARDRSAAALREGLLARIGPGVGLPRAAEPAAVVERVAGRTGRPAAEVASLLYGAPPRTDDELVRLAAELDRLEREVRRP